MNDEFFLSEKENEPLTKDKKILRVLDTIERNIKKLEEHSKKL